MKHIPQHGREIQRRMRGTTVTHERADNKNLGHLQTPGELLETLPSTMEKLEEAGLTCLFSFRYNENEQRKTYKNFEKKINSIEIDNTTLQLLKQYLLPCTLNSYNANNFLKQCRSLSTKIVQQYLNTWDNINKSNEAPGLPAIRNKKSLWSNDDIQKRTQRINYRKQQINELGNIDDQRNQFRNKVEKSVGTIGDTQRRHRLRDKVKNPVKTINGTEKILSKEDIQQLLKDKVNNLTRNTIKDDFMELCYTERTNARLNLWLENHKQEKKRICKEVYSSELNYKLATIVSTLGINIQTQKQEYPERTKMENTSDEEKRAKINEFFTKNYDLKTLKILNTPDQEEDQKSPKEQIIVHFYDQDKSGLKDLLDNQHDEYFFALIDLIVQRYLANINKDEKNLDDALFTHTDAIPTEIIQTIKQDKIPLNYFKAFLEFMSDYSDDYHTWGLRGLRWHGTPEEITNFNFTNLGDLREVKNLFGKLCDILPQFKQKFNKQYDAINSFRDIFKPEV